VTPAKGGATARQSSDESTVAPTGTSRSFALRCLAALVGISAIAAGLQAGDGNEMAKTLGDLTSVIVPGIAGLACLRQARRHPGDETAWRWLGVSCLMWAGGGAAWAYYGVARDRDYPFPALADVGWLGYALPAGIGLLSLRSRATPGIPRLCRSLDAAAIAAAVLFVSWATVLGDLYRAPAPGVLERLVVVIVSLVLTVAMRRSAGGRLPWFLLSAGFVTLAVSDSVYASRALSGDYEAGHLFDVTWAIAFTLVALAPAAPARPSSRDEQERRLTLTQELVPYLPIVAALVVVVSHPVPRTPFVFWNGVILVVLVAVRQVVIVAEKIRLAGNLEGQVHERTAQLQGERDLLAAVLDSLEEGVVACNADGVVTVYNDVTRRLLGLPADPVPPETWSEHYSLRAPDGLSPLAPEQVPLTRALRGNRVRNEEIVIAPRRGTHRLVRWNGRPLLGPGGERLGAVVALHDITDRRRAQLDLDYQAFHDRLTGLGNRAWFDTGATAMLLHAQGERTSVSALLVDLDDFKRVNDSLGQAVGDQVLVEFSRRLRGCVRDADLAVRLGGDEFAFVLEDSTAAHGVAVADRMLEALVPPVVVDGAEVIVGASIGIVGESGGMDSSQLLSGAELAMGEAKHNPNSRPVVFDPAMQALANARLTLESELRIGLRNGEFHLVYQPVVTLATGSITGVEALMRWHPPGRAPVPPADFIPVAERTGLIVALGEWVLTEASEQLARWDSSLPGSPSLAMAVNVSLCQLSGHQFVDVVEAVVASTGLRPGRLVLEITESAFRDDDSTAAVLRDLHGIGVRLSIDDFGTGYSSLARLHTSTVDFLKLDRSFVASIDSADADVPIVRAMVAMARGLGLRTIAEGIETPDQLAYLAGLGCDEGQGYLFSRPVPPEAIAQLLVARPAFDADALASTATAASRRD
jgi:diguanylate cyclase (GGDEF)-like protein/PAS domain S-box-containing protein